MSQLADYETMCRRHRWEVPTDYNIVADVCDRHPRDKLAMIYEGPDGGVRTVRWSEIQDGSARWGNLFRARGVRKGDRIAVLLHGSPQAAAVVLGGLRIGAIVVSMSQLWSDDSLAYRFGDCDPAVVVTDAAGLARPPVEHHDSVVDVDTDLSDFRTECPIARGSGDDPALIYYTSGSTGNPKGVVAPHRALPAHNEFVYCQDLRDGEVTYWMGDWAWGIYKVLGPWRLGAVSVVQQTGRRYDPERQLALMSAQHVTNTFLNPTGLRLMAEVDRAGERFPMDLRVCCSANEALGAREADWMREQYGVQVLENYGMTEAYPMIGNYLTMPVRTGSIGRPVPGWDVALLDEEEQPVEPGEPGEICLRAGSNPQYPLGYWNRPDETLRDFGGAWFHTKDAAVVDEDGYYFHQGRRDDVIISAGYRLSPQEIEDACASSPLVLQAGVIGVPDQRRGQSIKAFVRLADGIAPDADTADRIKQHVRTNHSAFGYPRAVEFVDELPSSQSGKLVRAPLRSRTPGTEF